MSEERRKYEAVKSKLKGLDVEYLSHNPDKSQEINMAKVNGYSIIWHEFAYCAGEEGTVEVMLPNGDVKGHYAIWRLRRLVSR